MTRHSLLRLAVCNLLLIGVILAIYAGHNQNRQKSYAASQDFPSQYFAPNVDATLAGNPFPGLISQAIRTAGTRYYELGSITTKAGQCQARWGGVNPLSYMQGDIANLRAIGGDVILNFGGYAGGNPNDPAVDPQQQEELALACPTVSSLQAQYQSAITAYRTTHVAFAIEGDALSNSKYAASISLRNQAIVGLKSGVPGTRLCVEFTLTGTTTGLTDQGEVLLEDAIDRGVNICVVNVLAMNYGSASPVNQPGVMGQYAVNAAKETFNQLKFLFPRKSDSQVWSMMGVTIMNGVNNSSGEGGREIFSLEDVQTVLQFAMRNRIRELSMWELHRDQSAPSGNIIVPTDTVTATPSMNSGIQQKPYEFSAALNTFTSGLKCPGQPGGSSPVIGIPPASGPAVPPSSVNVGSPPSSVSVTPNAVTTGSNSDNRGTQSKGSANNSIGNPNCIGTPNGTGNPSGTGTLTGSQNCSDTSGNNGNAQPLTQSGSSGLPGTKARGTQSVTVPGSTPSIIAPGSTPSITAPSGSNTTTSTLSLSISRSGGQFQVGQQVTYALTVCHLPQTGTPAILISDIISAGLTGLKSNSNNWQIVYNSAFSNGSIMVVALYTGPRTIPPGSTLPPFSFSGVLTPAAAPLLTSFGLAVTLEGTSGSLGTLGLTGLPGSLGVSLSAKITSGAATVDTLSVQSPTSQ